MNALVIKAYVEMKNAQQKKAAKPENNQKSQEKQSQDKP